MNHIDGMCRVERKTCLADGFDCFFRSELAALEQQTPQVRALDELHGDELDPIGVGQIVNTDYVLVGHLMGQQKFLLEAGDNGGVRGQIPANHFQRNEAIQFAVLGFVHRAHAAFAQQLQNFVASADHVPGVENGGADGHPPDSSSRRALACGRYRSEWHRGRQE